MMHSAAVDGAQGLPRRPATPAYPAGLRRYPHAEIDMTMSPMLFICLFLAGLGIFFLGSSALWWVSLQAQEMKARIAEGSRR